MSAADVLRALRRVARKEQAVSLQRFFKTGPGEYGEGDVFLGVMVPETRQVVQRFRELPITEIQTLLHSPYHEARLTALLILVHQFEHTTNETGRKKMVAFYLRERRFVNNWDLVDLSAHKIVGAYFFQERQASPLRRAGLPSKLVDLSRSRSIWDRRIAVLATFAAINHGNPNPSLEVATILLRDQHDLIHKAVGWMLREVGKRCSVRDEMQFLNRHASHMPRTMLRYAIERFPEKQRQTYLQAGN